MMQSARRAHIHWSIFNRRATPQDGMHRFPNADVFVGQDTLAPVPQSGWREEFLEPVCVSPVTVGLVGVHPSWQRACPTGGE
jgi:hypothetical protein